MVASSLLATPSAAAGKPSAYVFGDSLSVQATNDLTALAAHYSVSYVEFDGLAPCDWLGWRQTKELPRTRPSLAIIETAGVNGSTACMRVGGRPAVVGSAAFTRRYEAALATLTDELVAANRAVRIEYVGAPPMQSWVKNSEGDALYEWASREHRRVAQFHVDDGPRKALESIAGGFAMWLRCRRTETAAMGCDDGWIQVRATDGVHFFCPRLTAYLECAGYDAGAERWASAVDRLVPRRP